eukprot:gb/GEZN01031953.1/.p1 GENE.gb/GEZN01031953.1/~~gb/GEZN01031953.1/.p1  ORF type:complete len:106 (-),score=3.08 gb/GEZN01031953.1/:18-335(-)
MGMIEEERKKKRRKRDLLALVLNLLPTHLLLFLLFYHHTDVLGGGTLRAYKWLILHQLSDEQVVRALEGGNMHKQIARRTLVRCDESVVMESAVRIHLSFCHWLS